MHRIAAGVHVNSAHLTARGHCPVCAGVLSATPPSPPPRGHPLPHLTSKVRRGRPGSPPCLHECSAHIKGACCHLQLAISFVLAAGVTANLRNGGARGSRATAVCRDQRGRRAPCAGVGGNGVREIHRARQ